MNFIYIYYKNSNKMSSKTEKDSKTSKSINKPDTCIQIQVKYYATPLNFRFNNNSITHNYFSQVPCIDNDCKYKKQVLSKGFIDLKCIDHMLQHYHNMVNCKEIQVQYYATLLNFRFNKNSITHNYFSQVPCIDNECKYNKQFLSKGIIDLKCIDHMLIHYHNINNAPKVTDTNDVTKVTDTDYESDSDDESDTGDGTVSDYESDSDYESKVIDTVDMTPKISAAILIYMKKYLIQFISEFKLEKHFLDIDKKINSLAYDNDFLIDIINQGWQSCNYAPDYKLDILTPEFNEEIESQTMFVMRIYILNEKKRIERALNKSNQIVIYKKPILKSSGKTSEKSSKKLNVSFNPLFEVKEFTIERD